MAGPCNPEKFPWTPERAAALFRDLRDNYILKGESDPAKILDKMSANYNLKREYIIQGLNSAPGKLSRDTWLKMQNSRYATEQAKRMVTQMNTPQWKQNALKAIEAPRRSVLAGHFGAFSKSHLPDQLFYNPVEYGKNFARSWNLATKKGIALHEQRMAEVFTDADPDFVDAKRAGLIMGPKSRPFAKEIMESTGQRGVHAPKRTEMAFEELGMRRFEIFKKELQKLSPEERADIGQLKDLATVMNHDTGTLAKSNAVFRFMFLAPRLLPAQLTHVFHDIPKALFETGLGMRYKQAAPAMRYVARKAGILASAQSALLALNYAYYKWTGDEKNKPDLDITNVRSSSFRPKISGYTIPTSPTVELLKLPVAMINAGVRARKGENAFAEALNEGLKTFIGRQNPLFSLGEQAVFGQDPRTGQPTPFRGIVKKTEPTANKPTMTVKEWFAKEFPISIPISNYLRDLADELKDHGLPPKDVAGWLRAVVKPTFEDITSYHISKAYEPKGGKPFHPSNATHPGGMAPGQSTGRTRIH